MSFREWGEVVDLVLIPLGLDGSSSHGRDVSRETVANAMRAIDRFRQNNWSPPDEAYATMCGHVRFVWNDSPRCVITATIRETGRSIVQSARNGTVKWVHSM